MKNIKMILATIFVMLFLPMPVLAVDEIAKILSLSSEERNDFFLNLYYHDKDYSKVFNLCKMGSEKNDPISMFWFSVCYQDGKGVSKDDIKSFEWIKKAADLGCEQAYWGLACDYQIGRGTKKNYNEAIKYFLLVNHECLGLYHAAETFEILNNSKEAARLYHQAIKNGKHRTSNEWVEKSKQNLASLYSKGLISYEEYIGESGKPAVVDNGSSVEHPSTSKSFSSSSQSQGNQVKAYTESVPVQVWQACGGCNGTGQCSTCFGSGWTLNYKSEKQRCITCGGTGKCRSCAGNGGQNVVRYEQRTVYR